MAELPPVVESQALRRAQRRVVARGGFFGHGVIYIAAMILLLVLNIAATPDNLWFFWPMLAWLPALFGHGVFALGPGLRAIERWTDREYEREIARMTARSEKRVDGAGGE